MKRSKRIYILLGVLALACIATLGVMGYEEHREQIRNSEEIILEIPGDSVKALSWELDSESFSFRKEDTWIYEEDETFPADEEKIDALIEQFASFGVSFVIEEVEDYGLYGLDDPICRIRLETEEQSYEILLGNYSNMDSKRYVSIGDGNAYLVEEDPLEQFDTELRSLIRDDEIPYFETTTAIRFDGKETYAIVREENSRDTYCADDIYFTEQQGGQSPLDTSRVESYLSSIGSLGLTDYVTYHATEEELAAYGLDTPELTVTVDYTRENENKEEEPGTFVLHVSREREERDLGAETENAAESGGENEDGSRNEDSDEEEITAYARVGESQIVYRITGEEYKALTAASYNDLRHQEVLTADFSDVTRIDISLEGNSYTLPQRKRMRNGSGIIRRKRRRFGT